MNNNEDIEWFSSRLCDRTIEITGTCINLSKDISNKLGKRCDVGVSKNKDYLVLRKSTVLGVSILKNRMNSTSMISHLKLKHGIFKCIDKGDCFIAGFKDSYDFTDTCKPVDIHAHGTDIENIQTPDGLLCSDSSTVFTVSKNGSYKFTASDKAGNTVSKTINITNIDFTEPTLGVTESTTDWTNKPITLKAVADSSVCGIRNIQLPDNSIVSSSIATFQVSANGSYSFLVTGNNGATKLQTVNVSNIDITAPNEPVITRTTAGFSVTKLEDEQGGSGVSKCEVSIDGGAYALYTEEKKLTECGVHAIKARVFDLAGNCSTEAKLTITILPVIDLSKVIIHVTGTTCTISYSSDNKVGYSTAPYRYTMVSGTSAGWDRENSYTSGWTTESTYKYGDLTPITAYSVILDVRGINGDYTSTTLNFSTLFVAEVIPTIVISNTGINSTELSITNKQNIEYKIGLSCTSGTYYLDSNSNLTTEPTFISLPVNNITISNLTEDTLYNVSVIGKSTSGILTDTSTLQFRTKRRETQIVPDHLQRGIFDS